MWKVNRKWYERTPVVLVVSYFLGGGSMGILTLWKLIYVYTSNLCIFLYLYVYIIPESKTYLKTSFKKKKVNDNAQNIKELNKLKTVNVYDLFFFFSGGIANLDKNNSSFLVLAKYLSFFNLFHHWYLLENSPCLQKSSGKCDFLPLFSSTFRILFSYTLIHQTATRETPSPGSLNRARQTPLLGQRYDEHVSE